MDPIRDTQAIFMHDMLSEFEVEFNKFVKGRYCKTLELADGFNGSKQKFIHIIFHQFRQACGWNLTDSMNFDFEINPNSLPPFGEKLLSIILSKGPPLKCHIERISAVEVPFNKNSIKPPPVSKVLMRFTKV